MGDVGATATLYVCPGHTGPGAAVMASTATFGPLLTWDQVREVAAAGVEIGNHSLIHHPLDVLPPAVLDREVREGAYHTGVASVVQVVGLRSPAEHVATPPPAGFCRFPM